MQASSIKKAIGQPALFPSEDEVRIDNVTHFTPDYRKSVSALNPLYIVIHWNSCGCCDHFESVEWLYSTLNQTREAMPAWEQTTTIEHMDAAVVLTDDDDDAPHCGFHKLLHVGIHEDLPLKEADRDRDVACENSS